MLAYEYPLLGIFFSMLWFFIFVLWIMLVFRVFVDIIRDHSMGGFAKVLWIIFTIAAPFVGVFVYLIARGGKMAENEAKAAAAQEQAMREYVRQAAGTSGSAADELARLSDLHKQGVIDDAEFARLKSKVVG